MKAGNLRRMLIFWRSVPRTTKADESLAALLARRDRSARRKPARGSTHAGFVSARKTLTVPLPGLAPRPETEPETVVASGASKAEKPAEPTSTTSRLLDAKRRAQNKLK